MKKQIVFVVGKPDIISFKRAIVLREKGYETILISLLTNFDKKMYKKAFSQIICFNLNALSINFKNFFDILKKILFLELLKTINSIKKLKPYIIIGVAAPSPIWLCALTKMLTKKPFVYFPYDVNFLKYNDKASYKIAGIPEFELKAEKYCFENADGIIFKGNEFPYVKKNFKIKCPVLQFLPYYLKEEMVPINQNKLSKKDKELHLVYIGHVENKEQQSGYGMKSWKDVIERIINQKIHFHIYTRTQYNLLLHAREFSGLLKNKYFHLHKISSSLNLNKEISKYDFGCWTADFDFKIFKKEWVTTATGNKLTTFIEAGIPFIIYKNHLKFIYEIAKKYNICIGLTKKQVKNLKTILLNFDMKKFLKGIKKARKDFEISNNIQKLENFLKRVINLKNP